MASGSLKAFKLALIQLKVTASKRTNLNNARRLVLNASNEGADMVVLPECFNSPYGTSYFPTYAEQFPNGESFQALSAMAKEANVYLIGGSLPEQSEDGKSLFNTCTIWNKNGSFITTHRKIHLFDINVPGKITFKESDVLSSGHQLTQFDTPWGPIGIGICYDIRFPELAMIAARKGCIAMIYPGAFNMTTGPLHWELLQRARAIDNQIYVATCSPARDTSASYVAWGHSTIVDPMGQIVATTAEDENIVYGTINLDQIQETRNNIPVSKQRRFDLYPDIATGLTFEQ